MIFFSALDWAIELSNSSKVTLIHRRDEFRGAPASVQRIKELSGNKTIDLITKYSMKDVKGNGSLESVEIKSETGESKIIKADYVLGFFGLIMQLGPIAEWGLNLKKNNSVNTENFETNKKEYLQLGISVPIQANCSILSGFHEGASCRGCFKYARPDEKYRFEFTTASALSKIDWVLKNDWTLYRWYSNGWKISIMLEEIDFKYKLTKVNLSGDQFKPEFKKLVPLIKFL